MTDRDGTGRHDELAEALAAFNRMAAEVGLPKAQGLSRKRRVAERLSPLHDGVVAFSRSGDPDFGDWDDAVVLAAYGAVPPDVEPAAMAEAG